MPLSYILSLVLALCPRCDPSLRAGVLPTAEAIAAVARTDAEAQQLVVVAFVETGFAVGRGVIPFGAQERRRHHPRSTLVELATAAVETLRQGSACGLGFAARSVYFLTGRCGVPGREARLRARLLRRLNRVAVPVEETGCSG